MGDRSPHTWSLVHCLLECIKKLGWKWSSQNPNWYPGMDTGVPRAGLTHSATILPTTVGALIHKMGLSERGRPSSSRVVHTLPHTPLSTFCFPVCSIQCVCLLGWDLPPGGKMGDNFPTVFTLQHRSPSSSLWRRVPAAHLCPQSQCHLCEVCVLASVPPWV